LLAACLLVAILPVGAVRDRPYLLMAIVLVWLARLVTVWLDHRVPSEMTLGIWTLIGLLAAAAARGLRFQECSILPSKRRGAMLGKDT
jgi:hypothetical protein